MSACITGIGSRKTPAFIQKMMISLGEWCRDHNVYVRTGHADGADWAFEQGAGDHGIVYLPWSGFNSGLTLQTPHVVYYEQVCAKAKNAARDSVREFHPNSGALNRTAWKFMGRNYLQIMGSKPKPNPVQAVICWTPDGRGGGGTGQAIRIAEHYNIPVLDLGKGSEPSKTLLLNWVDRVTASRRQNRAE